MRGDLCVPGGFPDAHSMALCNGELVSLSESKPAPQDMGRVSGQMA